MIKMGAESQAGEEYIFTNVRIPQFLSNLIHFTVWTLTFIYMYNYLVNGNMPYRMFVKGDPLPLNHGNSQNRHEYSDLYLLKLPHIKNFI